MAKTLSRIVAQSVVVVRDKKRHTPVVGKPFDFTAEEIEYLEANSPASIRKAVNEDTADTEERPKGGDTGDDATAPDANAKPTSNRTPRRGANAAEKAAAKADEKAKDGDAGDDAGDDGEEEAEDTETETEDAEEAEEGEDSADEDDDI